MPESQVSALKQNVHRRQAHLPSPHTAFTPSYFILGLVSSINEHMEQRMQQENERV